MINLLVTLGGYEVRVCGKRKGYTIEIFSGWNTDSNQLFFREDVGYLGLFSLVEIRQYCASVYLEGSNA